MKNWIYVLIAIMGGLIACEKDDSTPVFNIGDLGPGGGIVFYDKGELTNDWRYLEAAPFDQAEGLTWGCKGSFIGNTSRKLGFGLENSTRVTDHCNIPGKRPLAFKACQILELNELTDWFLPSLEELTILYHNQKIVGEFRPGPYWSSSEERADDAWLIEFSNGDTYCEFKDQERRVRAIRRF